MSLDRLLTVAVALALVAGIGMTASTLTSSVQTTPDDAVDIDTSLLPIGAGQLQEYKERLQSGGGRGDDQHEEPLTAPRADGSKTDTRAGQGGPQERVSSMARKFGLTDDEQSLLEWLLSLLRELLAALPVLVGLVLLAIVVANRDRLASLLAGSGAASGGRTATGSSFRPAPENDVERAWYEMATIAGVEHLETTTPRRCAEIATDAGADATAVERLTRLFEEVRYGGAAVTEERRSRARETLRRVRTQLGGGA